MDKLVNLAADLSSLEDVQLKVWVPRPTELALEDLVLDVMKRARELGDVSRGEVVSALILEARSRTDIHALVQRYRKAKVHEIWPGDGRSEGRKVLPARKLGRPTRRIET